jgi:hypothetical protein
MAITIGMYSFEGPFISPDNFEDRSGVYAILDKRGDGLYYPLDIGESATVKTRVLNHDRRGCWEQQRQGILFFAVYYTYGFRQQERREVEQQLRMEYNPPCGER